jgi:uncharacterized membrane protein YphA (DoxX/SURF4 family)
MKNTMKFPLVLLRIFIGWHFLYEGLIKLFQGGWSSEAYLKGSYGFLSGFYHWLASDPGMVRVIDLVNIWGIILIGAGLFLGIFIRISAMSGILLLALYYFAYPPFGDAYTGFGTEGHYWIVNKNLVEAIALVVIYIYPVREYGLLKLIPLKFLRKLDKPALPEEVSDSPGEVSTIASERRELLKGLATLPFFGGMLIGTVSRARSLDPDALSGATIALKKADISDLKGELPMGKLGNLEVSRLYMGSNLINGIAHARDLHYARQLVRQYNTEEKLFETYSLAEQAGINMTNMGLPVYKVFDKYKKMSGSKMQTCVQALVNEKEQKDRYFTYSDRLSDFKVAIERGASTMYVQGTSGDSLLKNGRLDLIQEAVEYVQGQGYSCGIGAHSIEVIIACEKAGFKPDYYVKTMHHDNYWSAHPRESRVDFPEMSPDHNQYHDNIWDIFPEKTVEVFSKITVPLIGFKVLAAGAIKPADGFRYAFENGADFICVGMFDYQIVEDVNLVNQILNGDLKRSRPWYS